MLYIEAINLVERGLYFCLQNDDATEAGDFLIKEFAKLLRSDQDFNVFYFGGEVEAYYVVDYHAYKTFNFAAVQSLLRVIDRFITRLVEISKQLECEFESPTIELELVPKFIDRHDTILQIVFSIKTSSATFLMCRAHDSTFVNVTIDHDELADSDNTMSFVEIISALTKRQREIEQMIEFASDVMKEH